MTPSTPTRRPGEPYETWPGDGCVESDGWCQFIHAHIVTSPGILRRPRERKKISKIPDAPDDPTPLYIHQGFQRRQVMRNGVE